MDIWISIVVTFVLVLVNGYFSMSEMALVNARHVLLQHDADEGDKSAQRALGLAVQRRMGPDDGSWENVFLGNEKTDFQVELTWNRGRTEPYDNGGRDTHLAFEVDDMDAARALHEEMGCVCFVNERMGIYFIEDPDGCWLEILPADRAE